MAHANVIQTSPILTKWIAPSEQHRQIGTIVREWKSEAVPPAAMAKLGRVMTEIWEASMFLHPYPSIVVASLTDRPVGLLAAYRDYGNKCMMISDVAIRPDARLQVANGLIIDEHLVTAAIDESIDMGCFGWVACACDEQEASYWTQLGFYKHDSFTYRRMGYFR